MWDSFSMLWSAQLPDHRVVECKARLLPGGIDIAVFSDGLRCYGRLCDDGEGAVAWASEEQERWLERRRELLVGLTGGHFSDPK